METQNKISFKLLGIKTEQFATFEENYSEEDKNFGLQVNVQYKVSNENNWVGVVITFLFEQEKGTFLKIQVSCTFGVQPEQWNDYFKEDRFVFPKGFIQHLTVLTVGTTRGVLHAKTEGTCFNKFFIPTINVTEMVKDDVEILLNE